MYLGILFLTYSHESTQLEMQKNTVFLICFTNQADSGVKKSDPIPWQFGFENFAQILKLRGLGLYAWAFYSQSRRKCLTFYAGQFHA